MKTTLSFALLLLLVSACAQPAETPAESAVEMDAAAPADSSVATDSAAVVAE